MYPVSLSHLVTSNSNVPTAVKLYPVISSLVVPVNPTPPFELLSSTISAVPRDLS